jgi:ribosomal-protein-serine acetyltransferase
MNTIDLIRKRGATMEPILLDIPEKIESARLLLRMPKPGDGKEVNQAIRDSAEELKPWLHFARKLPTIEQTEKDIREAHAKFLTREDLRFHIYLKENGSFLGSTGLYNIDWEIPKFEIAYWLTSKTTGKGYMKEAVKALSDFTFEQLKANRVEMKIATENEASRKIPEKLGYTLEGTFKNDDIHADGSLMDRYVYAKTTI